MTDRTATVVAVQTVPEFGAVETNRSEIAATVRAHAHADLVVLPELSTTGYAFESRSELDRLAEPRDGETAHEWADLAAETESWVVGGFPEHGDDGVYNSALVVSPDGIEGCYRKAHLWNEEHRLFEAGEAVPVFETPFGRLGVQICNDLWFPELSIAQARMGVDLVAVPTNWVPGSSEGKRPAGWTMGVHLTVANANTNRLFFACADRAGAERGVEFQGQSVIVDPDGVPIAGPAPATGPHTIEAACDPRRARTKSLTAHDDAIADRRPELYDVELR